MAALHRRGIEFLLQILWKFFAPAAARFFISSLAVARGFLLMTFDIVVTLANYAKAPGPATDTISVGHIFQQQLNGLFLLLLLGANELDLQ